MCSLFFIGLGIHGAKGLSIIGAEVMKGCRSVYLDTYTNPLEPNFIESLQNEVSIQVKPVGREFVEDGRTILKEAEEGDVALLVAGDPMIATTHMDLRVRAEKRGIKTQVIHSSSILCSLAGETGLHAYKFGRVVTITKGAPASLPTVYQATYENLIKGLHTILLLEYDSSSSTQLTPNEALRSLLEFEDEMKLRVFVPDCFIIVACRVGWPSQKLFAGAIGSLLDKEYGEPPYVLIVPSSLHFTELEAMKVLLKVEPSKVEDNLKRVERLAKRMVSSYVEKTRRALRDVRSKLGELERARYGELLENVECYASDAERFLREGKEELAVLSIGYAEGLLDSLRFTKVVELKW